MTQVDFYLLPSNDAQKYLMYACRLTEKAFRQGLTVFLYTDQEILLKQLDEALWSFRPDSFLAHEICDQAPNQAPIQLSGKIFNTVTQAICINLGKKPFNNFAPYQRLIEIINNEKSALQMAREHFRHYQNQNTKPNTIDLRK